MAGVFATIEDLIESALNNHIDPAKIQALIDGQAAILKGQATMQADLLSIKAFLGVPDVRFGATQDQVDALGARVQSETAAVVNFDATVQPPTP